MSRKVPSWSAFVQTVGSSTLLRSYPIVGTFPNSIPESEEPDGLRPSFSDTSLENERAMWWAEFDSVGEEAVRNYVDRNSYTPTGMEAARQWLATREFLRLRTDMRAIRALAERAEASATELRKSAADTFIRVNEAEDNSLIAMELAAEAKRDARRLGMAGIITALLALGALVIVLASLRLNILR